LSKPDIVPTLHSIRIAATEQYAATWLIEMADFEDIELEVGFYADREEDVFAEARHALAVLLRRLADATTHWTRPE